MQSDDPIAEAQHIVAVSRLASRLKQYIAIFILCVTPWFGYLYLENAPIDKITQVFDANSITELGLFIYFTTWTFGAIDDITIQQTAIIRDPRLGDFGSSEVIAMIIFCMLFTSIYIFHDHLILFQICVLFLVVTNIVSHRIIVNRLNEAIDLSRAVFVRRNQHDSYYKLFALTCYMNGRWQHRRFILLFGLALAQVFLTLSVYNGFLKSYLGAYKINSIDGLTITNLLPSIAFLLFSIITAATIFLQRYKIKSIYASIDHVGLHYSLRKRSGVALPELQQKLLFD